MAADTNVDYTETLNLLNLKPSPDTDGVFHQGLASPAGNQTQQLGQDEALKPKPKPTSSSSTSTSQISVQLGFKFSNLNYYTSGQSCADAKYGSAMVKSPSTNENENE